MRFLSSNMIKMLKNINSVVKDRLCTGCGICENICPTDAISMRQAHGVFVPEIDNAKCVMCGLCYDTCGGVSVSLQSSAESLFSSGQIKDDYYIGKYISCYSGYSNDHDVRFHSAAGGMVSQFLLYLLEKKIIHGAVVVRFDSNNITLPEVFIAKSREDILSAKSSKYCPVSFHGIVEEVLKTDGKIVIVGLPCHIHSLRKFGTIKKELKNKVIGYFALYCSGNKTMQSQEFVFKKYGIDKACLQHFAYRDDGCMGYLKAVSKNNQIIKVPYLEYWHSMRGFFTPYRCTLCIDHFGELADISFGDIHVGIYAEDKIGVNSLITRSELWDNLLQQAQKDGYVTLDTISTDLVNKSQIYAKIYKKGPGVKTALAIRKIIGKKIPEYDISINAKINVKYLIRYVVHVFQRFIGKYKGLWFLIDYLDSLALFLKLGTKRKKLVPETF